MATPELGGWRPWELADLTVSEFRGVFQHMRQIQRNQQQS